MLTLLSNEIFWDELDMLCSKFLQDADKLKVPAPPLQAIQICQKIAPPTWIFVMTSLPWFYTVSSTFVSEYSSFSLPLFIYYFYILWFSMKNIVGRRDLSVFLKNGEMFANSEVAICHKNSNLKLCIFAFIYLVHVCACMHITVYIQRSEDYGRWFYHSRFWRSNSGGQAIQKIYSPTEDFSVPEEFKLVGI